MLNAFLVAALVLFVVILTVKGFFVSNVGVRQTSMAPTLADGDTIWVSKTAKVSRGCVAVFFEEDGADKFLSSFFGSDKKLVKRVVAIAGDSIWAEEDASGKYRFFIRDGETGQLYDETNYETHGKAVEIPTVNYEQLGNMKGHIGEDKAYVLPEDTFFAMGDNRGVSEDSRGSLGAVPYSRLFGVML